jgi:cell division protease FtsH
MLLAMWFWKFSTEGAGQPSVAYSQLFQLVEQGKVESVVFDGEVLGATLAKPEKLDGHESKELHSNVVPNDAQLLPLLRQKGVRITVKSQKQPFAFQMLMTLVPWILIVGVWFWMSKRAKGMLGAGGLFGGIGKNQSRKFDKATSVNVTFDDIAGLKAAKSDLQEIVQFLKEPERFQRLGGKVPRGVLLAGPPGTGKTLSPSSRSAPRNSSKCSWGSGRRASAISSKRPRRAHLPSCSSTKSMRWGARAELAWAAATTSANRP